MTRKWVKIGVLCFAWYSSSSMNNVVGKHLLTKYPHPLTLTLIQLISITIYSYPLIRYYLERPPLGISIPQGIYRTYIIPLAVGKFLASVASHVSIWKVPVSYAHTVKATMPLFTIFLTRLLLGTHHSKLTYLSLIPIITGVSIASVTELNYNLTGMTMALVSTLAFSLQNIYSKQVLQKTKLHQFELLFILAKLSTLFFLPVWLIFDFNTSYDLEIVILLFTDGLLSFMQNLLAFSFMNIVTPLGYSVANASKRVFIIGVSVFVFRNSVGWVNLVGMGVAVGGVFLYNYAKGVEREKVMLLPLNNNYV